MKIYIPKIQSIYLVLVLLFICPILTAQEINNSKSDSTVVELITMAPGPYYWEAFGHTAIRVKSGSKDYLYGFGYFDFNDEDFFIKFAQGEMQYFLGVVNTQKEFLSYKKQGRQIVGQKLNLNNDQKKQLISKLNHLAQPENRYYQYDYFLNNCTSQVRDLIDDATNGEISSQLNRISTHRSWNDLTFPVKNQTWMNLGIALGYGAGAYMSKNQWELSVFPNVFSEDLNNLTTKNDWNKNHQIYHQPSPKEREFSQYNVYKTHYAIVGSFLILLMGLLFKPTTKITIGFWLITQSFVGICLLLLWFFTKHSIAMYNFNVLLMCPIAFLLLFDRFRLNRYLMTFLAINILWLILAIVLGSLYLFGFFAINILMILKLKR